MEKWSYLYNSTKDIYDQLIYIRNKYNLRSLKDTMDICVAYVYKDLLERDAENVQNKKD